MDNNRALQPRQVAPAVGLGAVAWANWPANHLVGERDDCHIGERHVVGAVYLQREARRGDFTFEAVEAGRVEKADSQLPLDFAAGRRDIGVVSALCERQSDGSTLHTRITQADDGLLQRCYVRGSLSGREGVGEPEAHEARLAVVVSQRERGLEGQGQVSGECHSGSFFPGVAACWVGQSGLQRITQRASLITARIL